MPQRAPSGDCAHAVCTCQSCLLAWIDSKVNEGETEISCPNCRSQLGHADILEWASQATFEKLVDALVTSILDEFADEAESQIRPVAHESILASDSGQLHSDDSEPIFTCQECGTKACTVCNVPWHPEQTCADRQLETVNDDELKSKRVLAKISKSCPQCTAQIEKTGGCDHMTCRLCHHEFCWSCSAPYHGDYGVHVQGKDAHAIYCPFYPPGTPIVGEGWDEDEADGREEDPEEELGIYCPFYPPGTPIVDEGWDEDEADGREEDPEEELDHRYEEDGEAIAGFEASGEPGVNNVDYAPEHVDDDNEWNATNHGSDDAIGDHFDWNGEPAIAMGHDESNQIAPVIEHLSVHEVEQSEFDWQPTSLMLFSPVS
ncbi:MAG: hypothetical protein M1828_006131 [Chrysothrix sp. TS-e1954]|nr:MAG: hypothetical protein M1828_006131 [Chrysothrix sp. TS-e1954]